MTDESLIEAGTRAVLAVKYTPLSVDQMMSDPLNPERLVAAKQAKAAIKAHTEWLEAKKEADELWPHTIDHREGWLVADQEAAAQQEDKANGHS